MTPHLAQIEHYIDLIPSFSVALLHGSLGD